VVDKIGTVAYRLLLPSTTIVHPVFHVSQLKKAIPSTLSVTTELLGTITVDAFRYPIKVLQRRLKPHGDRLVAEVLIQWSSWPVSMATWELEAELQQQFPAAPAWGQAGFKGRRNVRRLKMVVPDRGENQKPDDEAQEEGAKPAHLPSGGPEAKERPKRVKKKNPKYFKPNWVAA
jgi:hypothetical protein